MRGSGTGLSVVIKTATIIVTYLSLVENKSLETGRKTKLTNTTKQAIEITCV